MEDRRNRDHRPLTTRKTRKTREDSSAGRRFACTRAPTSRSDGAAPSRAASATMIRWPSSSTSSPRSCPPAAAPGTRRACTSAPRSCRDGSRTTGSRRGYPWRRTPTASPFTSAPRTVGRKTRTVGRRTRTVGGAWRRTDGTPPVRATRPAFPERRPCSPLASPGVCGERTGVQLEGPRDGSHLTLSPVSPGSVAT